MAAKKKKKKGGGGALPQPPAMPQGGGGGSYQYQPTGESQFNQPYQDVMAAGNYQALPSQYARMQQQGQMGDIYGQGAAGTLGNYQRLMGPNMPIQGNLANEILGIQQGNLDVDPAMVQQFAQQQRGLESQLQRQLGPDAQTSSAGIEAMGRFNQGRQTALASANYNRLLGLMNAQQGGMLNLANVGAQQGGLYGANNMDLYNQTMGMRNNQLQGAGNMLNQASQTQGLYANIPQTMGNFGTQMQQGTQYDVNAQQPYQTDRFGQFQASQFPTKGQFTGQMMGQSGNRWVQVGNSIGSMGSPQQ